MLIVVDLSDEARILYSSYSIVDILGHTPDEVVNRSVWHFFHPEELPIAKAKYGRGVSLDKAAVLSYCRLKNRQGDWVGCECCFSIVYDVMVCCTSIYRHGMESQSKYTECRAVCDQLTLDQSVPSKRLSSASYSHHHQRILVTTCCLTSPANSTWAQTNKPTNPVQRFS